MKRLEGINIVERIYYRSSCMIVMLVAIGLEWCKVVLIIQR